MIYRNAISKICFGMMFLSTLIGVVFAEELKLTTYYPSPRGIYQEIRAKRAAVGETFSDSAQFNLDAYDGFLFAERGVSIGVTDPLANLDFTLQDGENVGLARAGSQIIGTPSFENMALGVESYLFGQQSVIVGGYRNKANFSWSFVGGGDSNEVYEHIFVGGGQLNRVDQFMSSIVGGGQNTIVSATYKNDSFFGSYEYYSFIGGGSQNISDKHPYSVLLGGVDNSIMMTLSTIAGGNSNRIESPGNSYYPSAHYIGGGARNMIRDGEFSSVIGGVDNTLISSGNYYNSPDLQPGYGIIGGGAYNTLDTVLVSAIGGGQNNVVSTVFPDLYTVPAGKSVIFGGGFNSIGNASWGGAIVSGNYNVISHAPYSFIGGGKDNMISGTTDEDVEGYQQRSSAIYSTIIGGEANKILGISAGIISAGEYSSISGGYANTVSSAWSDPVLYAWFDFANLDYPTSHISVFGGSSAFVYQSTYSSLLGGEYIYLEQDMASVVAGGANHQVQGWVSGSPLDDPTLAAVLGGDSAAVSARMVFSGGGTANVLSRNLGAVLAGGNNTISGVDAAAVIAARDSVGGSFVGGATAKLMIEDDASVLGASVDAQSSGFSLGKSMSSSLFAAGIFDYLHGDKGGTRVVDLLHDSAVIGGESINRAFTLSSYGYFSDFTRSAFFANRGTIDYLNSNDADSVVSFMCTRGIKLRSDPSHRVSLFKVTGTLLPTLQGFFAHDAVLINVNIINYLFSSPDLSGTVTIGGTVRMQTSTAKYAEYQNGALTFASDARLKKDVRSIDDFSAIEHLRPVTFVYKDASAQRVNYGFIAQEVKDVFPEAVSQDADGTYLLTDGAFTPLLVGYLKQQQKDIDAVRADLALLRARVMALKRGDR